MILRQNCYQEIFLKQKKMSRNLLFSHNPSNNFQNLIWFTLASHQALNINLLIWKLILWRSLNSINSQCTVQIQFQQLTQIVVNMPLILNSLMVVGNVQNAKTTTSRVANHVIVARNQNQMKIMMANLNTCSRRLKKKLSLKFKKIKQKN